MKVTIASLQALNASLSAQLCAANTEIATLRAKLGEADHRARKLIKSVNRMRNTDVSERRAAMEAARAKAMSLGIVAKVGG